MITALDKVKSTITLSLGTKNKLRTLKGNQSYENFINYLIRLRNEKVHVVVDTNAIIDFQQYQRKKSVLHLNNFNILFSYNKFNHSLNFRFDVAIEIVRENGKKIEFSELTQKLSNLLNKENLILEYKLYFQLLEKAIQEEIELRFRHNGRFEDYFSWEREIEILFLPKKVFEEDVLEKLRQYESRVSL